ELGTGEMVRRLGGVHRDSVFDVAVNDKFLVTGSTDYTVKGWDRSALQPIQVLEGIMGPVNAVGLMEEYVITAPAGYRIKIWPLSDWTCIRTIVASERGITTLSLPPSASRIISASLDNTIRIHDI
ncbi:WD40 repeat-like protein, partial [Zopfia rhizophila CBS 207.26]